MSKDKMIMKVDNSFSSFADFINVRMLVVIKGEKN